MKEQKITYELDKELEKETQDKVLELLKSAGAENVVINFTE